MSIGHKPHPIQAFATMWQSPLLKRANSAFYNFVRGTLGRVYDACFRPCDELTLPFDDEFFNDGEIWDLEGLMRNYHLCQSI